MCLIAQIEKVEHACTGLGYVFAEVFNLAPTIRARVSRVVRTQASSYHLNNLCFYLSLNLFKLDYII
jgi:hypothetical protein